MFNFVLYFPSLLEILSYFHNLKNKTGREKNSQNNMVE